MFLSADAPVSLTCMLPLQRNAEDITARKSTEFGLQAAEQALFEEKERAQVTLNSIGDAVVSTDALGNVTFLNQVAEKMTGWTGRHALGRPLAAADFCSLLQTMGEAMPQSQGDDAHE